MDYWANEDLVVNRTEQLRLMIGRRVEEIARLQPRGYVQPSDRGNQAAFQSSDGLIAIAFMEGAATSYFWGHESAQSLAVDVQLQPRLGDSASSDGFEADRFEMISSSSEFSDWSDLRGATVKSCGIVNWDRGARFAGYPAACGIYVDLDKDLQVIVAYQLVALDVDIIRTSTLAQHILDRLSYSPVE